MSQTLHLAKVIITNKEKPILDGALLVSDSQIKKVGRKTDFGNVEDSNLKVVDHGNSLICPGFINLHTHLTYTALGFVEGDKGLFPWLGELVERTKDWNEEDYKKSIELGVELSVSSGTTFIVENTPKADLSAAVLSASPLKALIGLEVFGSGEDAAENIFKDSLENLSSLLSPPFSSNIDFTFSPHAPYDVSKRLWEKLILWSSENNKLLLSHFEESRQERSWWQEKSGKAINFWKKIKKLEPKLKYWKKYDSGVDFLFENKLLNQNILGAHLTCASKSDLLRLKEEGVRLIHCPRSNCYLNNGVANLKLWNDLGILWGTGTDSLASNKDLDLLEELRFLINKQKLVYNYSLSNEEAFKSITSCAAKVLNKENIIGAIKEGAQADFLVYDLRKVSKDADPYYLIVWEINNKRDLKEVWISGEKVWIREAILHKI